MLGARESPLEVHGVGHPESLAGPQRAVLVPVPGDHGFHDPDGPATCLLPPQPHGEDRLAERERTAVPDGQFRALDLHHGVVHSDAGERRQAVLHGGNRDVPPAENRRERRVDDEGAVRGNLRRTGKVGTAESDAGARRRRPKHGAGRRAAVQADSKQGHPVLQGVLKGHADPDRSGELPGWHFSKKYAPSTAPD